MSLNTCEDNKSKTEDATVSTKTTEEFAVTMVTASEDIDIVHTSSDKETATELTGKQTPSTVQAAAVSKENGEVFQRMTTEDSVSSHRPVDKGASNQTGLKSQDENSNNGGDNLNNEAEPMDNDINSNMDVSRSSPFDHTELKFETSESCRNDHVVESTTGVCNVNGGASQVIDGVNNVSVKAVTGGTSQVLESSKVSGFVGSSLVAYSSSEDEGNSEDETGSEDSSSSSSTSDSESDDEKVADKKTQKRSNEEDLSSTPQPPKTKTEVMLEDLPTVPYVDFRLADDEEISLLGKVSSIIGQLVVVGSNKDTPALNEETVLFGKSRHPIGVVFEIFGPVCNPFYTVRFNTVKEITDLELKLNDDVYFAPKREEITKYVFVRELRRMKGSDASWANDEEPPPECLDYSDDEEERNAKKKKNLSEGKRKDARRRDTNSQPGRQVEHFHDASSNHQQQYRGTTSQHRQQSYNQRGPPSQSYTSFQGPQSHPSPWQYGGHHPPPLGNSIPPSVIPNQPPSNNWTAANSGPPPNLYNYRGFGHTHSVPPPMSPYSMPPPLFMPPSNSPFTSNPPPPPPGVPPGVAPRNPDFQ